jgi:hypothetical protein
LDPGAQTGDPGLAPSAEKALSPVDGIGLEGEFLDLRGKTVRREAADGRDIVRREQRGRSAPDVDRVQREVAGRGRGSGRFPLEPFSPRRGSRGRPSDAIEVAVRAFAFAERVMDVKTGAQRSSCRLFREAARFPQVLSS